MQGNCSDPDATTTLGLRLAAAASLLRLPLKPRQCLLLLPDTFLFTSGGHFWLDNLYLRLDRGRHGTPDAAFVIAGLRDYKVAIQSLHAAHLAVTNVTMHGDDRGPVNGIRLAVPESTALVQGV